MTCIPVVGEYDRPIILISRVPITGALRTSVEYKKSHDTSQSILKALENEQNVFSCSLNQ